MRPTCFLIDDRIAIDAGALTAALTIEEQVAVEAIFFSHSHFDHLVGLPFLADNIFPHRNEPVPVHGPADTIRCLREHLFNGHVWPDFSKISNGRTPVIAFHTIDAGRTIEIGGMEITPFPMEHTVQCHGYVIQAPQSALVICGDTCSTGMLPAVLPGVRNLKAVFLEASFPEGEAETARLSKHLSTGSFAVEARRIPAEVPVFACHAKPEFLDTIRSEIDALGMDNVALLEQDREYAF